MYENKSEPFLVFFDCSLEEWSVDVLEFVQAEAVFADEHASHITCFCLFLWDLSFDWLQEFVDFLWWIFEELGDLDWERLAVVSEADIALIDAEILLFFQVVYLLFFVFENLDELGHFLLFIFIFLF